MLKVNKKTSDFFLVFAVFSLNEVCKIPTFKDFLFWGVPLVGRLLDVGASHLTTPHPPPPQPPSKWRVERETNCCSQPGPGL